MQNIPVDYIIEPESIETSYQYKTPSISLLQSLGNEEDSEGVIHLATENIATHFMISPIQPKDIDMEQERVLGLITGEGFFQLFSLLKKIMDWAGDSNEDIGIDLDTERKGMKIDEEVGVTDVCEEEKRLQRATKSMKSALATKMMVTTMMHMKRTLMLL